MERQLRLPELDREGTLEQLFRDLATLTAEAPLREPAWYWSIRVERGSRPGSYGESNSLQLIALTPSRGKT